MVLFSVPQIAPHPGRVCVCVCVFAVAPSGPLRPDVVNTRRFFVIGSPGSAGHELNKTLCFFAVAPPGFFRVVFFCCSCPAEPWSKRARRGHSKKKHGRGGGWCFFVWLRPRRKLWSSAGRNNKTHSGRSPNGGAKKKKTAWTPGGAQQNFSGISTTGCEQNEGNKKKHPGPPTLIKGTLRPKF